MKITWIKRTAGYYCDSSGRFAIELQIYSPDAPLRAEWCVFDKDDKASHWPNHPVRTADRLREAKRLVDDILEIEESEEVDTK
jgi:hypothetical protein